MKKKLVSSLLAVSMLAVALTGCGNDGNTSGNTQNTAADNNAGTTVDNNAGGGRYVC